MVKIDCIKKSVFLYEGLSLLSCGLFCYYIINNSIWMSFACLLVYGIQGIVLSCIFGEKRHYIKTVDYNDLRKATEAWQRNRNTAIILCTIASLLDLFPILCMLEKFANILNCQPYEGGIIVSILIIIIIGAWIATVVEINNLDSPQKQINIRNKEEQRKNRLKQQEEQKKKQNIEIYGDNYIEISNSCIISPHSNKIWLRGKAYDFSQIIKVEYATGKPSVPITQEVTKTKAGSVIGRAIVGGLVAGPVGAIIGGSTAKKETSVIVYPQIENYTLIITISDVNNPIVKLHFDCNKRAAEKCKATIEAIIFRSNQKIE